jgi:hypothetical protein
MATYKGDIELASKTGSVGAGNVDWVIESASFKQVTDPGAMMIQAIFKALITPINSIGYGCGIRDLLGTKHTVASRIGIGMRLLRTIGLLQDWYGKKIVINNLMSGFSGTTFSEFRIYIDIGIAKGELLI